MCHLCVGCLFTLTDNVLALGEEADFEVLNFLPPLNLIRSEELQLSTEPAFLPNACYAVMLRLKIGGSIHFPQVADLR